MAKLNLAFRIDEQLEKRISRVETLLGPKIRELTGYGKRARSTVVRALIVKGIEQIEKENDPYPRMDMSRIDSDTNLSNRVDRIVRCMSPRIRSMLGRTPTREEIIMALVDRGASMVEKEYGLDESEIGHILVDDQKGQR